MEVHQLRCWDNRSTDSPSLFSCSLSVDTNSTVSVSVVTDVVLYLQLESLKIVVVFNGILRLLLLIPSSHQLKNFTQRHPLNVLIYFQIWFFFGLCKQSVHRKLWSLEDASPARMTRKQVERWILCHEDEDRLHFRLCFHSLNVLSQDLKEKKGVLGETSYWIRVSQTKLRL